MKESEIALVAARLSAAIIQSGGESITPEGAVKIYNQVKFLLETGVDDDEGLGVLPQTGLAR